MKLKTYQGALSLLLATTKEEDIMWGWNERGKSGTRTRSQTEDYLTEKIKHGVLKKLVKQSIKDGTILEICDLTHVSEKDVSDLLKHNIATYKDFIDNPKHLRRSTRVAMFAHNPCKETYELIKSYNLSKYEFDILVNSKANTHLDKYGLVLKMDASSWGVYVSRGRKTKMDRLKKFKEAYPTLRDKTDVRCAIRHHPILLSILDGDDIRAGSVSAKELISTMSRDIPEKRIREFVSRDFVDDLEQEAFLEAMEGKSKVSKYISENISKLKKITDPAVIEVDPNEVLGDEVLDDEEVLFMGDVDCND